MVNVPRSTRPPLQRLICAILNSAKGADLPVARLAHFTGRSRSQVYRAIGELLKQDVLAQGPDGRLLLHQVNYAAWHQAHQFDPLPVDLLGQQHSPSVLVAAAFVFREAVENRKFCRSDSERGTLSGTGRRTVVEAIELLKQVGARVTRKLVAFREGKKALRQVRLDEPVQLVYGLHRRKTTLESWSTDAANGRRGRCAAGAAAGARDDAGRFAKPVASQPPVAVASGINLPSSSKRGAPHAAKMGENPSEQDGQNLREEMSGLLQRIGLGGRAGEEQRAKERQTVSDHGREAILDTETIMRKVGRMAPREAVHALLETCGVFVGQYGRKKITERRWAMAEALWRKLGPDAWRTVLQVCQDAARSKAVKNLGAVLGSQRDGRLWRLLRNGLAALNVTARTPSVTPGHSAPGATDIDRIKRQQWSHAIGAAETGAWAKVWRIIESDLGQRFGINPVTLSDASGVPEATIRAHQPQAATATA